MNNKDSKFNNIIIFILLLIGFIGLLFKMLLSIRENDNFLIQYSILSFSFGYNLFLCILYILGVFHFGKTIFIPFLIGVISFVVITITNIIIDIYLFKNRKDTINSECFSSKIKLIISILSVFSIGPTIYLFFLFKILGTNFIYIINLITNLILTAPILLFQPLFYLLNFKSNKKITTIVFSSIYIISLLITSLLLLLN